MESWDTYWHGLPYWDGYPYGPFAESSRCVSTGSRHVCVANFQSGMMPVLASSENGSCILLVVLERLTHLKTRLATAFASCC